MEQLKWLKGFKLAEHIEIAAFTFFFFLVSSFFSSNLANSANANAWSTKRSHESSADWACRLAPTSLDYQSDLPFGPLLLSKNIFEKQQINMALPMKPISRFQNWWFRRQWVMS